MMKALTLMMIAFMTGTSAFAAKKEVSREPASAMTLSALHAKLGAGRFISIDRLEDVKNGEMGYAVTVSFSTAKSDIKVQDVTNGDFFAVVQELCSSGTVIRSDRASFFCYTK